MTLTRALTAAVLIPAVVAVVLWGSTGLVAAATGLVTMLALLEFFALGGRIGMHGYRVWTCFCALVLLLHQWTASLAESWSLGDGGLVIPNPSGLRTPWVFELDAVVFLFVLGTVALAVASRRGLAEALPSISVSAAGLLLVALPLSFIVRLHGVRLDGPKLLLFMLVLVWAGDTLAYFVGRAAGRLPMAPQISPRKTWEGAAANLFGSLLVAVVFARWLAIEPRHLLMMAGLANLAGQAGDLFESAYKRSAGAKDSGVLLPGHGGMLDRIDALILAAPVVWYYFDLIVSRRG
jgi:phosphatidate cytidylyltransferase